MLDLIEQEVDAFHAGEDPDFELLRMIVHYLRHYPDRFHHPREDVAFTLLVERDPQLQLRIARRMQEHVVIAASGEELLNCLEGILAGSVIKRAALAKAAATYLVYYRHQLASEEQLVIPRAVALLTAAEWSAVAAIPAEADPLFGANSQASYDELRRSLARARTGENQCRTVCAGRLFRRT